MNAERQPNGNEWPFGTLHHHMQVQLDSLNRVIEERFCSSKESVSNAMRAATLATDKAESAMNQRLAGMNELRGALSDQAAKFVTRAQFEESQKATLETRIATTEKFELLNTRLDRMEGATAGKQSTSDNSRANIAIAISAVTGILYVIISLLPMLKQVAR